MGNQSSSSAHHGHQASASSSSSRTRAPPLIDSPPPMTSVDGGFLEPQSHLYASSSSEYSRPTVHKLILERRLAPFYLGLNDFEEEWTVDQIIAALEEGDRQASTNLREALVAATEAATEAEVAQLSNPSTTRKGKEAAVALSNAVLHREKLAEIIRTKEKRGGGLHWSPIADQAKLYLGEAVECPICFLYYPPAIVHTRCCDQPICTECFVQIKRADPTTTHLESEPAACPFCMEPNFGCLYIREKQTERPEIHTVQSNGSGSSSVEDTPPVAPVAPKPRRKSFAHTEKSVVTTDQIHPDWEAKVEAVRATVARRANRRIVFRQVGDRLIPVGITSGRESDGPNATMTTQALPPGFAAQVAAALDANGSGGGGREGRRATRRRNQEMAHYLETMGVNVGQDLEEMMVMEAMRLSLQEDEARQQAEDKAKAAAAPNGQATLLPSPAAETSAQGAARSSTAGANTVSLLSEAMDEPLTQSSLLDPSPRVGGSTALPSMPVMIPNQHRPSPIRVPFARNQHQQSPSPSSSTGALAAGGLAAFVSTPNATSSFPQQGESTTGASLPRGIVGAGLTARAPLRASEHSPSSSSPPQLPELVQHAPLGISPPDRSATPTLQSTSRTSTPVPVRPPLVEMVSTSSIATDASYEPSISSTVGYERLDDEGDDDEGDDDLGSSRNGSAFLAVDDVEGRERRRRASTSASSRSLISHTVA